MRLPLVLLVCFWSLHAGAIGLAWPDQGGGGTPGDQAITQTLWEPHKIPGLGLGSGLPTTNQCTCILKYLYGKMLDVDSVYMLVTIADANDVVKFGLYSQNGLVQFFEATINVTVATLTIHSNIIASPPVMGPGSFWACVVRDNVSPSSELSRVNATGSTSVVARFIQSSGDCGLGDMPDTLSSPVVTFVSGTDETWFAVTDVP